MRSDSMKRTIDQMSYSDMLYRWRFAKTGDPMFQGEVGEYFSKVMKEKSEKLAAGEHAKISKDIGWGREKRP